MSASTPTPAASLSVTSTPTNMATMSAGAPLGLATVIKPNQALPHSTVSVPNSVSISSQSNCSLSPANSIEDIEKMLASLYSDRVELLKQLSDIETNARALEVQLAERHRPHSTQRLQEYLPTGNVEVDKIRHILALCLESSGGVQDALKVVEACKEIHRSTQHSGGGAAPGAERPEGYAAKNRFRNLFVHETIERAAELMVDPTGSTFMAHVLDLFSRSGQVAPTLHDVDYDVSSVEKGGKRISEVLLLLEKVGPMLPSISADTSGARCVQKLVDVLESIEELGAYCETFVGNVVTLVQDINGTHAISRLLGMPKFIMLSQQDEEKTRSEEQLQRGAKVHKAFFEDIANNCIEFCKNRHGCCVIQRCLLWAPEPYRSELVNIILNNTMKLIQDPFGNYVMQHILDRQQQALNQDPEDPQVSTYTNAIIRKMLHNVASLSCNKFSSNVVEKCLRTASPDVRQLLVDELTDPLVLPKLLTDSYANYVIQTAIVTASDDAQFAQLRDAITPLQVLLKNSPYGVKVEAKLQKRAREATRRQSRLTSSSGNGGGGGANRRDAAPGGAAGARNSGGGDKSASPAAHAAGAPHGSVNPLAGLDMSYNPALATRQQQQQQLYQTNMAHFHHQQRPQLGYALQLYPTQLGMGTLGAQQQLYQSAGGAVQTQPQTGVPVHNAAQPAVGFPKGSGVSASGVSTFIDPSSLLNGFSQLSAGLPNEQHMQRQHPLNSAAAAHLAFNGLQQQSMLNTMQLMFPAGSQGLLSLSPQTAASYAGATVGSWNERVADPSTIPNVYM